VAQRLNLTRATITVITKKLKEFDLIFEAGKGTSSEGRGRKEVLLTVNPNAGFVLSAHIALNHFSVGLLDLTGKVIEKMGQPFQLDSAPQAVLSPISEIIQKIMDKYKIQKQKIFDIVIAIPGVIDYKRGMLREITLKGWQGFELKSYFEDKFDIKVLLENDVKTYTMGEFYFGIGKHVNSMICLWLGDGIGAGIINNGQLVRGVASSAGEIGFNEFILGQSPNTSILTAGEVRYWSDVLSITNIIATINRGIEEGWKTNLKSDASIVDFVAAIDRGDPLGIYIFKLMSNVIGAIGLNCTYTFNPEILLLSGPLVYQLPQLAGEVRAYFKKGILRSPIESVEVKTSILGEDGLLIGSVALMLDYLFGNADNHFMES
jgi:predicted NBD/HSP70 family sugar kinase